MAPADPELDDGADDEPNEPELDDDPELDDEPELADEPEPEVAPLPEDPVLEDPVLEDPVPDDPVPELAECPVLAEFDDPVLLLLVVLCAAAGSPTITTPAAATPTIPAPMVALRSRRRAWSRAEMADTVRSSLFITELLCTATDPSSLGPGDLAALGSPSVLALSSQGFRPGRRGRTALPARPPRPHSGRGRRRRHA